MLQQPKIFMNIGWTKDMKKAKVSRSGCRCYDRFLELKNRKIYKIWGAGKIRSYELHWCIYSTDKSIDRTKRGEKETFGNLPDKQMVLSLLHLNKLNDTALNYHFQNTRAG